MDGHCEIKSMYIYLPCFVKKMADPLFGIQWVVPFLQNKGDIYSIGYVGDW